MQTLTPEDLELLRDTATRFFSDEMPLASLRRLRDDVDPTGFDRDRWRDMADMGWTGILVGEDDGGIDFGYAALGVVLEQSGRTLAASPLVSTALIGAPLIAALANEAQRAAVLGDVVAGNCILALALDERARHTPDVITTTATASGDGYSISGEKTFVLDGHIADRLLVVARTSGEPQARDGISVFLVDPETTGITRRRTLMVDGRNAANITFANVAVPSTALLGPRDGAGPALEAVLDGARAGLAAEMLGTGLEAFDRTIEYLKVREQFGVPIGSFQALKHRAAEMYCELELARSAAYAALEALDARDDDTAELASLAKTKACEMLELVSNEAVQLHGGIGMTDAADIGLFLKRARVAQQCFGDALFHRNRYADLIGI